MTVEELTSKFPALEPYLRDMPEWLKTRYTVHTYPAGQIIHQKNTPLDYFGLVCDGDHRVINEFENGNVFMIEKNEAVDFIGEVTILAGMPETSVTIETLTPCTVMVFSRTDFEAWIAQDNNFLRRVAGKVAFKLYRSSYQQGEKLFYPPTFLLLNYILKYAAGEGIEGRPGVLVHKTRQEIYEELGMSVKTVNRTVSKLKEAGLVSIRRGKLAMTAEQYRRGLTELKEYLH